MTSVGSYRRYVLLKIHFHQRVLEFELASAYLAKFADTSGEPLPAWVPAQGKLEAALYTTLEDLRGADSEELMIEAGLTRAEAGEVLTAIYRGAASCAPTINMDSAGKCVGAASSAPALNIKATGQAA